MSRVTAVVYGWSYREICQLCISSVLTAREVFFWYLWATSTHALVYSGIKISRWRSYQIDAMDERNYHWIPKWRYHDEICVKSEKLNNGNFHEFFQIFSWGWKKFVNIIYWKSILNTYQFLSTWYLSVIFLYI